MKPLDVAPFVLFAFSLGMLCDSRLQRSYIKALEDLLRERGELIEKAVFLLKAHGIIKPEKLAPPALKIVKDETT
jgi:hypothetical protein